jgi:hypothetical protein
VYKPAVPSEYELVLPSAVADAATASLNTAPMRVSSEKVDGFVLVYPHGVRMALPYEWKDMYDLIESLFSTRKLLSACVSGSDPADGPA